MVSVRRDSFGRVYVEWRSDDGLQSITEKVMDEDLETVLKRMRKRDKEEDDGQEN